MTALGGARRRFIAPTAIGVVACLAIGVALLKVRALGPGAAAAERAASRRMARSWRPGATPPESPRVAVPAAGDPALAATRPTIEAWPRWHESSSLLADLGDRLARARRDADVSLSKETRSWLDENADALDAWIAFRLADRPPPPVSVMVCGNYRRHEVRMTWDSQHDPRMARTWTGEAAVLAADALRWMEEGDPALARQSLEAIVHDTEPSATETSRLLSGLIRRVRPGNAAEWAEWLDELSPMEELLDILQRRAMQERDPEPFRFDSVTLDVLYQDLPESVRTTFEAGALAPMEDARWSRRSWRILAVHDDLVAGPGCLPDRTDVAPVDPEWGVDWRAAWQQAVLAEADLFLTREVLRLAHPEAGIAPRASPCPDWSIEVETLPDGTRRLAIVGSVAELARMTSGAPPLAYELPPEGASPGDSR